MQEKPSASSSSMRAADVESDSVPEAERPTKEWALKAGGWAPKKPPEESATELKDSVEIDTREHVDADVPTKIENETAA